MLSLIRLGINGPLIPEIPRRFIGEQKLPLKLILNGYWNANGLTNAVNTPAMFSFVFDIAL